MSKAPIQFSPFSTTVPGYPRVGPNRNYKTLLEKLWKGDLSELEFDRAMDAHRCERLLAQEGLDLIPCGDFSRYDHLLDTAIQFGCIPERFEWDGGKVGSDLYFAMARGRNGFPPLEMTKWFDTNYHYLVPELPSTFRLTANSSLEAFSFGKSVVGDKAKPVVLGPFTFLKLSRLSDSRLRVRLEELTSLYEQVLEELVLAGAKFVQMDEPSLAGDASAVELEAFRQCYEQLGSKFPLLIQTYYGDVKPSFSVLRDLPVVGLGLDLVRGLDGNLEALAGGFPKDKFLVAGVVDGRNIWRTDLDEAFQLVEELSNKVEPERLVLGGSCSFLHLPETTRVEQRASPVIVRALSFAQERIQELKLLSKAFRDGKAAVLREWTQTTEALDNWANYAERFDQAVQEKVNGLDIVNVPRMSYQERRVIQDELLGLPTIPTTTIGSFPQTLELRKARKRREENVEAYEKAIFNEIEAVIRLQEEIGLDVLVHGEPERNDMVQFFGDQMKGFTTTEQGWVQSYGSRCVRPPIIFGDVDRLSPMTIKELKFAQSLTSKPVKGMLTGPVTILQWSFVREDIPRREVAYQIAFAIRDEIRDLEDAGLRIIQIDEAAFREGLPLRLQDRSEYMDWAVQAFKIATGGAAPQTQVHTHMCYSEFGDMIEAIVAMDADVISIEDARSEGALLASLGSSGYPYQIGPGIYDIHSPNVPSVDFMIGRIRSNLSCLSSSQIWVNPDCGLKTRRYEEVTQSLKNMVAAAEHVRRELKK